MIRATIVSLLIIIASSSYGQVNSPTKEQRRLVRLLQASMNREAIKDTNAVVMFAYKVHIKRDSLGNYIILSTSVSDSSANLYFPNSDFLKTIDYKTLAGDKKEAIVVMPFAILMSYPTEINGGFVTLDSLANQLIKYLYLHDEKSEPVDTSKFIYFPIGISKTSSLVEY